MKTVVITGASRGIGLATAKKFLAEGWGVVGTYLNTPILLESSNLISIKLDLSAPESINAAAKEITKTTLHIDAMVNNAGVILDSRDVVGDVEKIRKTLEVDLLGVIDLTEQLLPVMGTGSHIVNLDSNYGSFSFPMDDTTSTGYRLAKAALNMYTRTLAFRTAGRKIIVSSLDPGWVKTDMGFDVADEISKPDREPEDPAEDIFKLVTTVTESGQFWRFGKKREW